MSTISTSSMPIKTFKVKHGFDIEQGLFDKAIQVAHWALEHGSVSTKYVRHIGLNSGMSNQILRKYGLNVKAKTIRDDHVKLVLPGSSQKYDRITRQIYCSAFRHQINGGKFRCWFPGSFTKLNQIEFDKTYAYVSVTFPDVDTQKPDGFIGIDLNSTSHSIVVADPSTGKVTKFARQIPHIKKQYRSLRRKYARQHRFRDIKALKRRDHDKTQDVLHKATTAIVLKAKAEGKGIKLEDLKNIRKNCTVKHRKSANHVLNSWPFFMVRTMLEYKAKEHGVRLVAIDPAWTSTTCSRCGNIDKAARQRKVFHCLKCGHVDHADANAAFNIASRPGIDPATKASHRRGRRVVKAIQAEVPEGQFS